MGDPGHLKKLSHKHKRFIEYYIQSGNIRQSSISAGFHHRDGYRFMKMPLIRAEIDRRLVDERDNIKRVGAAALEALLASLTASPYDAVDGQGNLKEKIPERLKRAANKLTIKKFDQGQSFSISIPSKAPLIRTGLQLAGLLKLDEFADEAQEEIDAAAEIASRLHELSERRRTSTMAKLVDATSPEEAADILAVLGETKPTSPD